MTTGRNLQNQSHWLRYANVTRSSGAHAAPNIAVQCCQQKGRFVIRRKKEDVRKHIFCPPTKEAKNQKLLNNIILRLFYQMNDPNVYISY